MAVDPASFKAGLRHWASGVTIVTTATPARAHGMTVSAFTSVSLDPPLVSVCADKASITNGLLQESGSFAVHVLAAGQADLSNHFAVKETEEARFEGIDYRTGALGAPIIDGCLAVLECTVAAAHDAGDHVVYLGRVEVVTHGEGEPLLYFAGRYRTLT